MFNWCKHTKLPVKGLMAILFLASALTLPAQDSRDITFDESAFKAGLQASPNGFGFVFRNVAPSRKSLGKVLDVNFTSVRHYKEKTILNQRSVNTSPYIFGKINKFFALRPMAGIQKTLAEKRSKNSVGINMFGVAGPALGFLKPVYVNVEMIDPNNPNAYISVARKYEPEKISPSAIIGNASFVKGLDETKLVAGLSFKTGVEFNWGYYSSEFKSIEVGVLIDYFPSRPELLYNIKNKSVYSSFYLSFAIGKNY